MDRLPLNGTELAYVEQGAGIPVVLVHGAWMDLRYWEPQRDALADRYRFVAYNSRYHGTDPWPDAGEHHSVATHAADLAGLIRALGAGPVHLVTLSSGAIYGAIVALEHPDLVRSLTLAEPAMAALLADLPEANTALEERRRGFEPIVALLKAGDATSATRMFFDLVNHRGESAFERQPEPFRRMVMDNARTLPLLLPALASVRTAAISCTGLGGVTVPTLVVGGADT